MTTTAQRTLLSAWGLFASMLLLMMGRGLVGVVIGVRAEFEGFSTTMTGVIMACYFAGFLAGSQVTPRIMAGVGHIRTYAGLAALVAVTGLLHALWIAPLPWIVLRLIFGFCMAGLFVVAESWLNESVTNENRGRIMAVYMVVSMGGAGLGELLLSTGDPTGTNLFLVAGALVSLAVVPISLSISSAPAFTLPPREGPGFIWNAAPLGIVAALLSGFANSALLGMSAVYATQVGMSVSRTALFAGSASLGAVVFQWPIGRLSDGVGRRRMILIVAVAATAVGAVATGIDTESLLIVAAMFLFGGLSYTMYSLALSHAIDVLPVGRAVTASSTIVFTTGVGAVFGPIVASLVMSVAGPVGFWWTVSAALGALAVYAVARIVRRPSLEVERPQPYLAVPARSTGIVRLVFRNGKRTRSTKRDLRDWSRS